MARARSVEAGEKGIVTHLSDCLPPCVATENVHKVHGDYVHALSLASQVRFLQESRHCHQILNVNVSITKLPKRLN